MPRIESPPTRAQPHAERVRHVLAASSFFRDLPAATLERIAAITRPVRYRDGDLVQGASPPRPRFHIVLAGALRVCPITAEDGTSTTLAVMGPGGAYGAAYFVAPPNLSWGECYAIGDTELAVAEEGPFRLALQSDPVLEKHICVLLILRFNAMLSLFRDVVKSPLPERLARRLLAQALALSRPSVPGEIEVDVTQAMLAEMLRASRSQVSAELRRWHEAGIVRVGYRRLYILDSAALCRIAGPDVRPF